MEQEFKTYYSINTCRFTLRCNHPDWLVRTQEFYNLVFTFYYDLFLKLEAAGSRLSELSGQKALRELEVLTIVGRNKEPVRYPLPWEKAPLYFRRAAVNRAVAAARARLGCNTGRKWEEDEREKQNGPSGHECVTYYKGMYRNLTGHSVDLKVWTGHRWEFLHCRLYGNTLPEGCECLSPSVQLREKYIYLNVPVRNLVPDGRKARERYHQGGRICSIQFGSGDVFAVGVVLEGTGEEIGFQYFRGGAEYEHRCRQIAARIEKAAEARKPKKAKDTKEATDLKNGMDVKDTIDIKNGMDAKKTIDIKNAMDDKEATEDIKAGKAVDSNKCMGPQKAKTHDGNIWTEKAEPSAEISSDNPAPAVKVLREKRYEPLDKKRWMKLKHINEYYSNVISRQVINYITENQVEMLILPGYRKEYSKFVKIASGNWSSIHLSTKIREQLYQKSWKAGILLLETAPVGCGSVCAVCGASIRKKGKEYMCENGHKGNRYLNTARNLGIRFLESMAGKER